MPPRAPRALRMPSPRPVTLGHNGVNPPRTAVDRRECAAVPGCHAVGAGQAHHADGCCVASPIRLDPAPSPIHPGTPALRGMGADRGGRGKKRKSEGLKAAASLVPRSSRAKAGSAPPTTMVPHGPRHRKVRPAQGRSPQVPQPYQRHQSHVVPQHSGRQLTETAHPRPPGRDLDDLSRDPEVQVLEGSPIRCRVK